MNVQDIDDMIKAQRRALASLERMRDEVRADTPSATHVPAVWRSRLAELRDREGDRWVTSKTLGRLLGLQSTPTELTEDLRPLIGVRWALGDIIVALESRRAQNRREWRLSPIEPPDGALYISISGPPGSGKTTILNAIAVMVEPTHHVERIAARAHELVLRRR